MARKADYSNTQKYSNRRSFDGKPVPTGKVLVPFRIDLFDLKKKDYIDENCTTMRLGDFRYHIGFMAIDEAQYPSYMKGFWDELNKDMEVPTSSAPIPEGAKAVRTRDFSNATTLIVLRFSQSIMSMTEKPSILRILPSRLLKIRCWTGFVRSPR